MRIAITGSNGFIGKALKFKLQNSGNIEIIDINRSENLDILDFNNLVKNTPDFDVMVHLAAKSFVPDSYLQPHSFYTSNVAGTLNVLELCRAKNAKMIFMSSYMYGEPNYLPIDEKHEVKAFNPYCASKLMAENLCNYYAMYHGVQSTILRLFNVYGIGQSDFFLIPKIISLALQNKTISLHSSIPKRDYIYLDDVIDCLDLVIQKDTNLQFEIFNIGYGKSYSPKEILDIVEQQIQIKYSFSEDIRPNEVMDTLCNNSKFSKAFGWQAKTSLKEGIKKMLTHQ